MDKAPAWLDDYRAYDPGRPFFMYWAPGGVHGPHHVFREWGDKYEGKFATGWHTYCERTYRRQLELGVIPQRSMLNPRDETMAAWDAMKISAGFVEHTDTEVGRLVDGISARGLGEQDSISELLAQNNIPNTVEQRIAALDRVGGLDALGAGATDNM